MLKLKPSEEGGETPEVIPNPEHLEAAVNFVVQEIDKRGLTPDEWRREAFDFAEEYWGDRGSSHVRHLIGRLGQLWTKRQSAEYDEMAEDTRKALAEVAARSQQLDEIILGRSKAGEARLQFLQELLATNKADNPGNQHRKTKKLTEGEGI